MKSSSKVLIIMCLLLATSHLLAQVDTAWVRRYDGPGSGEDYTSAIVVDDSGNVYITGYSWGSGTHYDYATVKYDAEGNQRWAARYSGPGGPGNPMDRARAIAIDRQGNVYVTGGSEGSGTWSDYLTIKYNSAGVEQWVRRYNGPANSTEEALAIAVDGSDNVYVTGFDHGSGTAADYATIKYNSAGVEQWVRRYNGPANDLDIATAMAVDSSGYIYVTGWSYGLDTLSDYATIKYNSSGVQQWVARYNGPADSTEEALAIAVDGSDNVYVTGRSYGSGTDEDYATVKYDANGNEVWVRRYNGPANYIDRPSSIAADGAGNVYVTGSEWSFGPDTLLSYATIKYNSTGQELWVKRYNGPTGYDGAQALAVDKQGNVYVTGLSYGLDTLSDYATIKYGPAGQELWVKRYNGPADSTDWGKAIAVDGHGNVYVTGSSASIGLDTSFDYCTIKYLQTLLAGVLTGRVLEAGTHLPLENATVEILKGSQVIKRTTSLPNGKFTVPDLSPGLYAARASKTGYQTYTTEENILISSGQTTIIDDFELVRVGQLPPWGTPLGSFIGIVAYSNRNPPQPQPESLYGLLYECTEFVNRFYAQALAHPNIWKLLAPYRPRHAYRYFALASYAQLQTLENGGIASPQIGDIVCWDSTLSIPYGHVAIIRKVVIIAPDDELNDTVYVIHQNVTQNYPDANTPVLMKKTAIGRYFIAPRYGDPTLGWLRKPRTLFSSLFPDTFVCVDDNYSEAESSGFYLYGDSLTWQRWHEKAGGASRNSAFYFSTQELTEINSVIWQPYLPRDGNYQVFAFTPSSHASTNCARYKIYHNQGMTEIVINQDSIRRGQDTLGGIYVILDTFSFSAGTAGYVTLSDLTGEIGKEIGVDALLFSLVGGGGPIEESRCFYKIEPQFSVFPNPFKSRTILRYSFPVEGMVSLRIYDASGRLVRTLTRGIEEAGFHSAVWNGENDDGKELGSGVYFCVLETEGKKKQQKVLLMK